MSFFPKQNLKEHKESSSKISRYFRNSAINTYNYVYFVCVRARACGGV